MMRVKVLVTMILFLSGATIATAAVVQSKPKSIFLTETSTVEPQNILKSLQHECPNVTVSSDAATADYTLEATHSHGFLFTLSDHEKSFRGFAYSLTDAVRNVCHLINNGVTVEVMSDVTLTQSVDARGVGTGVEGIVNAATGRRTSTDSSSMYVIVNGEHALLDCYERRTGCSTIAPGKYFGELKEGSLWVSYDMPITHAPTRNHYKVAGSW